MSSNCPEGVRNFSYKPDSSKGSKQPADVQAGQPAVQKLGGGSKGSGAKAAGGSAGGVPGGVKQASGAEHLGGKPKTMQAATKGAGKPSGANATPAVNKYKASSV